MTDTDRLPEPPARRARVLALLVARDGARWLPEALAALAGQLRPPDAVIGVDVASTDATRDLLTAALGASCVVAAPPTAGFGAAVLAGLAGCDEWDLLWLLHDDSAPAPEALQQLLEEAERSPGAGVLGPKVVDWHDPRRLVEVGLSVDRSGHRVSGLDDRELDQGQHDDVRDALSVGTAGMLVRHRTWQRLEGFDPQLPLLGEEVDFGWRAHLAGERVLVVPRARLRHLQATRTGQRTAAVRPRPGRRLERAHALYTLLVNAAAVRVPLVLLRLLLGGALRGLGYLLTRQVGAARDESLATLRALFSVRCWLRGRRWRRGQRLGARRVVTPLLAPRGARWRAWLAVLTAGGAPPVSRTGAFETGPAEADDELPPAEPSRLRAALLRPVTALVAVLTVLALVANRHLLAAGVLAGGRLLPMPTSGVLWRDYLAGWHSGALGSGGPAAPWEPLAALAGLLFGGAASTAVAALLVLAAPLAAVAAWRATRDLDLEQAPRLWGALAYALLSGLSADVGTGRFDVVVAVVALPGLLRSGGRVLREDPATYGWRRAVALGIGLALSCAFAPQLYPAAAVLLLAGGAVTMLEAPPALRSGGRRRALAGLLALVTAPLLLLPWTVQVVAHPRELLTGLGGPGRLAGAPGSPLGPAGLLLLHPGSPGAGVPAVLSAALILAALAGLTRSVRRRRAAGGVAVAAVGYLLALADARQPAPPGYGWPGVGMALAAAGLLFAALVATQGARHSLGRRAFGWRQLLTAAVAAVAAASPLAAAGWLLAAGTPGEVARTAASPLPAFAADDAALDPGERVLLLRVGEPQGASAPALDYLIGPARGPRAGEEDLRTPASLLRLEASTVADLAAPLGTDAAQVLATFQVRYVALLTGPAAGRRRGVAALQQQVAAALDQSPALSRVAAPGTALLWQVALPVGRLQLLAGAPAREALSAAPPSAAQGRGPRLAALAADPPLTLPLPSPGHPVAVPAGPPGRLLVLADVADPHWRARLGGVALPRRTAWNWAQGFALPPGGGLLTLSYDGSARDGLLAAQGALLLAALILAAPSVRPGDDDRPAVPDPLREETVGSR